MSFTIKGFNSSLNNLDKMAFVSSDKFYPFLIGLTYVFVSSLSLQPSLEPAVGDKLS